jgi:hypothetical protein
MTDIALSNIDIVDLLDCKCKIVLYPDLYKYKTLDEILGANRTCIVLFESQPNYGHWVCIIRRDNDVEFFNSYGGYPDDTLKHIETKFALKPHQNKPYLSMLIMKSPYNLFYNEFKFQKEKGDIKTCGRHCVVRAKHKNLDIYDYKEKLDALCEKYNTDYDNIVTMMTS